MNIDNILKSLGVIHGFIALIILFAIVFGTIKFGMKSLIWWIIIGIIAYLYISSNILKLQ